MELRHLKYFLSVAEQLSFVKAADKLCISQPPLSRQIKELEDELNVRLFERNNKRVALTEAGRYFETEIRQMFQSLERITIKAQKIAANVSGEYRIAYISSTYSEDISKLMKHLSELYPYVNFKLYEVPTARQIAALEQGKIDLGIIRAPIYSPKVSAQLWFHDGYSLVYNKNLLQIESEKDIEKLGNATFIFFNKDYAPDYYNSLLEVCAKYSFRPNVVHESNNIGSIVQLVRNGLGISIVPTGTAKNYQYDEISYCELKEANLFTEVMLASPKGEDSEITKAAMAYLLAKND